MIPTPSTSPELPQRLSDFATVAEALDYAAQGLAGVNFYSGKGELVEALPYRDLRRQALVLARRLLAAGLAPGDRVAAIAESDADFLRVFYACQYAGLVPTPLPLPAAFGGRDGYVDHLGRMLRRAGARAAFGPAALGDWLDAAGHGLELVHTGTIAQLDGLEADHVALPVPDPDGLSYLQFSSGSTRFPLGVAVTQSALLANTRAMAVDGLGIGPRDRGSSWLPLYHDMGLVGCVFVPLTCQLSIDLMPTREFARRPLVWLDLISRNRATLSYSPSFGYELCARRAETAATDHLDLGSWRVAGSGGDMIRPAVLRRFAERFAPRGFTPGAFTASYGMAEATLALSFAPLGQGIGVDPVDLAAVEDDGVARPATATTRRTREFMRCGPVLPGHRVVVRGTDGEALPERRVGRLFAAGPSLMKAYFGQPEETARVLSAEGWLDTGDLGYLTGGQVVITGRAKDLIIVNGRNLWPQDLEWSAESEIDGLRSGDVAAFSVDGDDGETVVALVQSRATRPELREALREAVAGLFRSRHGIAVDVVLVPPHSLPQTSSGKLSRSRAKALYLSGALIADPPRAAYAS